MRLAKLTAKPLNKKAMEQIIARSLDRLKKAGKFRQIILFGSAAREEMTEGSDLDFLVIYANHQDLREGRSLFYQTKPTQDSWPMDVLFMTEEEFLRGAKIGGVCYLAQKEGQVLIAKTQNEKPT
jgi:predicted nucleotidyltransferase